MQTTHIIDLTGVKPASPRSPAGGLKGPPVSGVEFLDVQHRLLQPAEQETQRLREWLAVAWISAFCGWLTVAGILLLVSR